jgi:hypothetical protein
MFTEKHTHTHTANTLSGSLASSLLRMDGKK